MSLKGGTPTEYYLLGHPFRVHPSLVSLPGVFASLKHPGY